MSKPPAPEILALSLDSPLFPAVRAIRQKVYVEEQNCPPAEEWDNHDAAATHLLALLAGQAAGTLRYYDDAGWLHIGRLAVYPEFRGRGIARALLDYCLEAGRKAAFQRAFLNAQVDKMGLYQSYGFEAVGEEFMEAGIRHFRMERVFTAAQIPMPHPARP